jgi:hypothetical protein
MIEVIILKKKVKIQKWSWWINILCLKEFIQMEQKQSDEENLVWIILLGIMINYQNISGRWTNKIIRLFIFFLEDLIIYFHRGSLCYGKSFDFFLLTIIDFCCFSAGLCFLDRWFICLRISGKCSCTSMFKHGQLFLIDI